MKICVTSTGPDLDSQISPVFGRCQYFLIVEEEKGLKLTKVISNESLNAIRGAGVAAAQTVVSYSPDVVITGNVGPNAFMMLSQAGVRVYRGTGGSIKDVLKSFKEGKLNEIKEPVGRFGFGRGFGRGRGRGFGRGRI